MKQQIKILFFFFSLSCFTFAEEEIKMERDRGIEKMNFYIPTKKQSKYTTFSEADFRNNKNIYQWTLAEGHQSLQNTWDLQYKIEKEDHQDRKNMKKYTQIWDNEISFLKYHTPIVIKEKKWQRKSIFGIKYYERKNSIEKENQYFKLLVGQKFSSFFPFGKGGSYLELEFLTSRIFANNKNGYSFSTSLKGVHNLGYGIQWLNTLEYEYLNYNQYTNSHKNKWETILRWTYEWNENFAFSPEATLKIEKYYHSPEEYITEASIGPNLLFSKNIQEELRIYGKIGIPIFRRDENKSKNYRESKSQFTIYGKIGIEYIF